MNLHLPHEHSDCTYFAITRNTFPGIFRRPSFEEISITPLEHYEEQYNSANSLSTTNLTSKDQRLDILNKAALKLNTPYIAMNISILATVTTLIGLAIAEGYTKAHVHPQVIVGILWATFGGIFFVHLIMSRYMLYVLVEAVIELNEYETDRCTDLKWSIRTSTLGDLLARSCVGGHGTYPYAILKLSFV